MVRCFLYCSVSVLVLAVGFWLFGVALCLVFGVLGDPEASPTHQTLNNLACEPNITPPSIPVIWATPPTPTPRKRARQRERRATHFTVSVRTTASRAGPIQVAVTSSASPAAAAASGAREERSTVALAAPSAFVVTCGRGGGLGGFGQRLRRFRSLRGSGGIGGVFAGGLGASCGGCGQVERATRERSSRESRAKRKPMGGPNAWQIQRTHSQQDFPGTGAAGRARDTRHAPECQGGRGRRRTRQGSSGSLS
jgi:hypothetical protein